MNLKRIINHISNMETKKLMFITGYLQYIIVFFMCLALFVSFGLYILNGEYYYRQIGIAQGIFVVFLIPDMLYRYLIPKVLNNIFFNNLEFDKYLKIVKSLVGSNGRDSHYKIMEAHKYFYLGEFEKAKEIILDLKATKKAKRSDFNILINYYTLLFLTNINLNKVDEAEVILKKFKELKLKKEFKKDHNKSIDTFDCVYDVLVLKKPNDYFEIKEYNYELPKLYYKYFLNGVNSINSGKVDKTVTLFLELKDFDEKLFFVREAKKWLREYE